MNFRELIGETVILRSKGKFYQAKVYERREYLYALKGGAFIGLYGNRTTSDTAIGWEEISCDYIEARFGKLAITTEMLADLKLMEKSRAEVEAEEKAIL